MSGGTSTTKYGGDDGVVPRDLSGSWDSPGQTRRGEEGGDGPQVGRYAGIGGGVFVSVRKVFYVFYFSGPEVGQGDPRDEPTFR